MLSSQADILAASALILALLGVVYALWYGEVDGALQLRPQPLRRKEDFDSALVILRTRAVPLAVATVLDLLVFLPPVVATDRNWVNNLVHQPLVAVTNYDAVPVALNLATGLTAGLALETVRRAIALRSHCYRDLKP